MDTRSLWGNELYRGKCGKPPRSETCAETQGGPSAKTAYCQRHSSLPGAMNPVLASDTSPSFAHLPAKRSNHAIIGARLVQQPDRHYSFCPRCVSYISQSLSFFVSIPQPSSLSWITLLTYPPFYSNVTAKKRNTVRSHPPKSSGRHVRSAQQRRMVQSWFPARFDHHIRWKRRRSGPTTPI